MSRHSSGGACRTASRYGFFEDLPWLPQCTFLCARSLVRLKLITHLPYLLIKSLHRKGVCVLSSLRLIVNTVIELETPLHQSNKTVSQNDVMELLFTGEPNFFASMVQNIKEFKQDLLARIRQQHSQLPANEPELEELLNQQCTNKCTYIENIQKRIEFLIIRKPLQQPPALRPHKVIGPPTSPPTAPTQWPASCLEWTLFPRSPSSLQC